MNKYFRKNNGVYVHMGKSVRSISVRLPESVYDMVMECKGDCFSQKLINLIISYKLMTDSSDSEKCNSSGM